MLHVREDVDVVSGYNPGVVFARSTFEPVFRTYVLIWMLNSYMHTTQRQRKDERERQRT